MPHFIYHGTFGSAIGKKSMEGTKHYNAKFRAMELLGKLGCDSICVEEPKAGVTFDQEKTFSCDAYGELNLKIAIEIDGNVNHGTKITIAKDKFRDLDNLDRNKTYTIRFTTDDFVSLTDKGIMDEIRWSLRRQGFLLI